MSTIRRTFQRGTANDGTTRFYEQPEQGAEQAIGQLDLSAWALSELGDPAAITVKSDGRGGAVILESHDIYDARVRHPGGMT